MAVRQHFFDSYGIGSQAKILREVIQEVIRVLHAVFDTATDPDPAELHRLYVMFKPGLATEFKTVTIEKSA